MYFNHPLSKMRIANCFFTNLSADLGACILANHVSGELIVEKNVFIENFGITEWRVLIGAGSVLQTAGTSATKIYFSGNIILFNVVEYTGLFFNFLNEN
jgi:hypothetical protein